MSASVVVDCDKTIAGMILTSYRHWAGFTEQAIHWTNTDTDT